MSLYSRLDRIAADVEKLNRQITSVANHPQSQRTSVEGGSIDFNDDDGNLMAIVGSQDDGGNTINVISGPTPPTPVGFTVDTDHGKFIVHWSGDFDGDKLAPSDWSRAEVHASQDPFFVPSRATARGSIVSAAGGEVTIGVLKGPWTIKMLAWSQAGKMSAPSAPVDVEVPGYGDIVLEEIDAAQTRIENARAILVDGQETLGTKLDEADTALASLRDSLDNLDETTLPALRQDLDAAKGRLSTAEGQITDAFGQLDAVPGQISDARQAAIDAAQADAEAKADAAESAAKAHADLVAEGAEADAVAAAQVKAQELADAAQDAAEAAAQVKADAARDEAISDATGKIATARQEAIDAALAEIDSVEGGLVSSIDKKVTWSLDAPPTVFDGPKDATWFRVSSFGSGGQVVSQWRWNGTVWVSTVMSESVLAKVAIGTGTYGELDGNRLRAGSVLSDRVLVGAGRNILPWSQVLSGATTAPHKNWDYFGAGTFECAPGDASRGVPGHAVHNRTTNDPGIDRYVIQLAPAPYTKAHSDKFAVSGGTWSLSVHAYTDVADLDARLALVWYRADGGYGAASTSAPVRLGSQPKKLNVTLELPDDAALMVAGIRTNQPGETHWVNPELAPAVGGTLIEPGGIQTPHLAADVLEVGNLKAGAGEIAEVVSQKIAAAVGQFLELDVGQLTVTGASKLASVVAEQIAADVGEYVELSVGQLVAGEGVMDEAVIQKLFTDVVVAGIAQAQEFIGENAILTGAVTAPKITASEELWAKIAQFVQIRAEHIESDAIDGMVVRGLTLIAGNDRHRLDDSGYALFDDNGDRRTFLSPEGSTFKGEVEAETFVANGGAELRGTNNTLAQGAKLTLAAGVTDPTAPPVVQPFWGGLEFEPVFMNGSGPVGLAWDGTNYITVGSNRADTGVAAYYTGVHAMKVNGTTGVASQLRCDFSAAALNEQRVSEAFGVTCIGSELFFLGRYGYAGYVWVTDLDGVFKRRISYPDLSYSATNRLVYRPGIGNNGTDLVIAQCNDSGVLFLRTYNKTTGAKISDVGDEPNGGTRSDITGVYVGDADWGRKLNTVAQARTSELTSFNPTTGAYDGDGTKFNAAATGSTGVVYVDGKFRTLDPSGVIHEYADTNTGDASGDWWATYYWYTDVDDDSVIESSDYQSRMAPPARFTWPRRAGLKILGQPMPDGVEALGPALAKKTTTPVRTDFSGPGWQVDAGKSSARYTSLPTNWTTYASPSATNTFPEAESSVLESASGTFKVQGDGSGHWGPLKMGRNGVMSGLVVTGQASCAVTTAGTPRKFTIQLPAGRFTKPPVVWLSPLTSSPQNVAVSVVGADITTTSFALWFWRNDTSGTGVDWFAMDSE